MSTAHLSAILTLSSIWAFSSPLLIFFFFCFPFNIPSSPPLVQTISLFCFSPSFPEFPVSTKLLTGRWYFLLSVHSILSLQTPDGPLDETTARVTNDLHGRELCPISVNLFIPLEMEPISFSWVPDCPADSGILHVPVWRGVATYVTSGLSPWKDGTCYPLFSLSPSYGGKTGTSNFRYEIETLGSRWQNKTR